MKKKNDIRLKINISLTVIFLLLSGIFAEINQFGLSVLLQSLGICTYVAWLFVQRDKYIKT